jgi:Fic family protein
VRLWIDHGAWEDWLSFFVDGVGQVATEATERAVAIVELRREHEALVRARLGKRTPNALATLDYLFRQPVVSAKLIEETLSVSQPTAAALVRDLTAIDILRESTGKRRNRLFRYHRYLALFPRAESRG